MVLTCCVVGCSTSKVKNPALTFHAIKRPRNPSWESDLIRIVNRCDKSFNRNRATICSRHFTRDCFTPENAGLLWLTTSTLIHQACAKFFSITDIGILLELIDFNSLHQDLSEIMGNAQNKNNWNDNLFRILYCSPTEIKPWPINAHPHWYCCLINCQPFCAYQYICKHIYALR